METQPASVDIKSPPTTPEESPKDPKDTKDSTVGDRKQSIKDGDRKQSIKEGDRKQSIGTKSYKQNSLKLGFLKCTVISR